MSSGDTGFIMLCSALVFLMTPGLAFFYGGLVRRKNVVNTMMACVSIMGLSIVMWVLFGDSHLFAAQLISIVVTIAVAICGTWLCIALVRIFTPLRVRVSDEISGMDFSQHGENANPSFSGFDS